MLTDQEKWRFDLHGYLLLKGAVPADDVARMVELSNDWHNRSEEDLPEPIKTYQDPSTKPTTPRSLNNPEYVEDVFQRLILNPEIMRVVLALTRNAPQHLGCGFTRNTRHCDKIPFHGGTSGGLRNPANDYQAADGQVFATFLNAGVSLVDVPAGGGFACIPGSHKSHFPWPQDEIDVDDGPPIVDNPAIRAGDVVLFTEALCHGACKWTLDTPRRSVFVRYCTSYASWSPGSGPKPGFEDRLWDEVHELKERAPHGHRKKVVRRFLEEMGEGEG